MTTTVKLKNSVTTTNAPISLQQGEVAINITDKKVWVGNAATTPVQLVGAGIDGSFVNLAYTGTFTGGTGVITIGTDQIYKDAAGNIGLGTIVPTDRLTVTGVGETSTISDAGNKQAAIRVSSSGGNANDGGQIEFGAGFGSYAQSYFSAIKGLLSDGTGNTLGNLAFYTRNATANTSLSERMRITSAGNIGISTSNPVTKLHVEGLNSTSPSYTNGDPVGSTLYLQDSAGASGNGGGILFGAVQGAFAGIKGFIENGTGPAGALIFQTRSTSGNINERLRITSAGDVGIGTSDPTYKLTINTVVPQDESTTGLAMQLNSSNADSFSAGILNINSNDSQAANLGGSITFGGHYISNTSGVSFAGIAGRKENSTSGETGGYLQFLTRINAGNTTEQMRITSVGLLQFNSGYGSVATAYGCRAWVNFNGDANSNLTGTYTQTGTTVTVTITAHGYTTGQFASLDFTSGTAVDGTYEVTVIDANDFTVTQASRTTIGNVTDRRCTIRASGNVTSVADNGTGDYTVNFTTAMPDANYAVNATLDNGSTGVGAVINIDRDATATPLTTQSVRLQCVTTADTPNVLDSEFICITIFR